METQVLNCDVGAGSLIVTAINCMLESRPARAAPCNIFGGQSGTGTGSSPSTLVFRFEYQYQYPPMVYSHFYLNSALVRRISARSRGASRQSTAKETYFHFFFLYFFLSFFCTRFQRPT